MQNAPTVLVPVSLCAAAAASKCYCCNTLLKCSNQRLPTAENQHTSARDKYQKEEQGN
jgi:hypothetical protein